MINGTNVKINLGLHVLRKRSDGYHDLQTLFVPCTSFGDTLEIVPSTSFSISINGPGVDWKPDSDLTAAAYRLLKAEFPALPPVRIGLTKGAPVGAGLGGGSADAAAALTMLNEMFGLGLSSSALASRAAKLGSDCAFFIYNRPMLGTGRGEVLTPFELDLSGFEIRTVVPAGVKVSTREAYAGIVPEQRPLEALTSVLNLGPRQWRERLTNDFERSVFPQHPEIAALKQQMYSDGAVYAAMSGSGSAVFGIFEK